MSYGERYVKAYNKKFEEICLKSKKQFESYYNTNYSFIKSKKLNEKPLVEEIKFITSSLGLNREVYDRCSRILEKERYNYTSDVTISLINDEVKEAFLYSTEKNTPSIDYNDFIESFSVRQAIYNYFLFFDKNNEELTKKFNSKKIGDFLNVVKTKREIHSLQNLKKPKKEIKESNYNLTNNEKMILLHVLMHRFVKENFSRVSTEYFRVLSLTSECLEEKDINLAITNEKKYNYFLNGLNASQKSSYDKNKMIDDILNKIKEVKNIKNFKNCLLMYKMRK